MRHATGALILLLLITPAFAREQPPKPDSLTFLDVFGLDIPARLAIFSHLTEGTDARYAGRIGAYAPELT